MHEGLQSEVESLLENSIATMELNCPCGGPGFWTRIAHLNMSDSSQQCPPNWNLTTTPVRGCGRSTGNGCDSAVFSSKGLPYSRVCGRVNVYQKGSTDGFGHYLLVNKSVGLEGPYIDGVSLTHGPAGSRQHIWSFVATLYEFTDGNYIAPTCSCSNSAIEWPYTIPPFVNNSYFCDSGHHGPTWNRTFVFVYSDDPMWDGEGCGPTSTCCQLNNPPCFCTTLPEPTTDDIELRICLDDAIPVYEDAIISIMDIYITN